MLLKIVLCVLFIMVLLYAIFNVFINKFSSWFEYKGGGIRICNEELDTTDYIDFQCSIIMWLKTYTQFCIYNFDNIKIEKDGNGLFALESDGKTNNAENKSECIKQGEKRLLKFLSKAPPPDILVKILNYELIYRIKSGQEDYVIDDLNKLTSVMYDLQKDTIIYHYGVPTKYRFIDYFEMIYVYYMTLCCYKDSNNVRISDKIEITRHNENNLKFKLEGAEVYLTVNDKMMIENDAINNFQNIDIELLDIPKISPFSCQYIHPNNTI